MITNFDCYDDIVVDCGDIVDKINLDVKINNDRTVNVTGKVYQPCDRKLVKYDQHFQSLNDALYDGLSDIVNRYYLGESRYSTYRLITKRYKYIEISPTHGKILLTIIVQ